jgi:murein DD-endopeptidase
MVKKIRWCLYLLAAVAPSVCAQAVRERISVQIPQEPIRVTIDGKSVVYYELQLKNTSHDTVAIRSVTIVGEKPLLMIKDRALEDAVSSVVVIPQHTVTLYIELNDVPESNSRLNHQVEYAVRSKHNDNTNIFQVSAVASLVKKTAVVLAPPLREGNWAAIYSPVWQRGHRRVQFSFEGVDYLPGRFAIDFVRLDSAGRYVSAKEDSVANWYGYGNAVYAVAQGVVVAVRTDFVESPTLSGHPAYAAADATGNFVAIDIGHGNVVFYEHLKPGSIRVSRGEKVREGQVLGAIGFTGQSTGPHLHLHVADGPLPLRAQGLPFVFRDFQLVGRYPDFGVFGKSRWSPVTPPVEIKHERPAPNTVIRFPRY